MIIPLCSYLYPIVLLLGLTLLPSQVYGQKTSWVSSVPKKLIRVGIFPMPPLNYFNEAGEATGLYPDLIRAMLEEEQWKTEFVPCSWSVCLEKLQNGEISLMTTIAYTPERAMVMDYSKEPVADIWGQIFALPAGNITDIGNLEGKTVGIASRDVNGANFKKTAASLGVACQIQEFTTHEEIFRAIQNQQIVAGVAPQHFGHLQAKNFGVVGSSIVFSPFSVYFAVKKGEHNDILNHFDEQLARWKLDSNSVYYQAINRWMGGREYKKIIPRWLLWLGGSFFFLALLLLVANRTLQAQVRHRTRDLRASEKDYRQLIEGVNSIIIKCDSKGRILFLNRYGLETFGYPEKEIIGLNINDTIIPPTSGDGVDLKSTVGKILREPQKYVLAEHENICKDGRRLTIQWTNQAIIDDQGNIKEILSVGTDLTERKKLEAELRQAQKFEAIATLAGGIAHDFNNILAVILGYAELAKLGAHHGQNNSEEIQAVITASYRAKELVQQILTFSRKSTKKNSPLMPSTIVKESLKLLKATLPASIELHEEIDCKNFKILADPVQIQQIVVNLCTNAAQAMPDGHGRLSVELKPKELSRRDLAEEESISPGWFVELTVSDTGTGIAPENRDRIFEPYFTTKKKGEGTGMGLAMVHGIVRELGGLIKMASGEGRGTTFRIYFPVFKADVNQQEKEMEPARRANLPTGNERIMVIDDEKSIAELLCSILGGLGYKVTSLIDSKKALVDFSNNSSGYDLILTDQTMPGLTGSELACEILKIRPDMPIILCTGHSDYIGQEQATRIGIKEFMMKPIGISDLAEAVRKVLDNTKAG